MTIELAPAVESEPLTREEILRAVDEQSQLLGYEPGRFVQLAEAGDVPDTGATTHLLVLLGLLDSD